MLEKLSILGFLLLLLFILPFQKEQSASPKVTLVNTEVERPNLTSCKYTLERTHQNLKNQNLKVHVSLFSENGLSAGDFNWVDDTLKTENPRLDFLYTPVCPSYVTKNGVASIEYSLRDQNGKVIERKTIEVSNKFIDKTQSSPSR